MFTSMRAYLAAPILAMLFQGSFSTAQTANLRASFTTSANFGAPRATTAQLAASPRTCGASNLGALFLDSTTNTLKYCNGTAYVEVSGGGVGSASGIQGFATGSLPACAAGTTNLVVYDTTLKQLMLCNGTAYAPKVGTTLLYSTPVAVATVGTSEETVGTYTLPAGFLDTDGNTLSMEAGGTCAANANSKTFRMYFGATQMVTAAVACNATGWRIVGSVMRRTATTQATGAQVSAVGNAGAGNSVNAAETLSGTVAMTIKLLTATAGGDATMQYFYVTSVR